MIRSGILRKIAVGTLGFCLSLSAGAGTITGTIKFEGEPPVMKELPVTADPACAAMHKDSPIVNEALVLGDGQTMANVLVVVTKGVPEKEYPAPAEPMVVTQHGCQYAPHVFAVQAGQTVKFLNPDGVLHNVNGMAKKNTAFNRAMPKELTELEVKLDKPEDAFELKCDIHPWMKAYCAVIAHPFFNITGKDGAYKIDNLPAGEYEITAWHERLGKQTATVTVADAAPGAHDFAFSRPAAAK